MSDLADRLRQGRDVAARGELSLDRDRAREKLRAYRLADPHHYVLHLVRAASVLGATKIEFAVLPRTVSCIFDAALPPGELAELWNAPFVERQTSSQEALRSLALAVGSAQALGPQFVEVISGGERLLLRDEDEELAHLPHEPGRRTKVVVREKFHIRHVAEFLTSLAGRLPEEVALRARCSHSLLEVLVNDALVSTAFSMPGEEFEPPGGDGSHHVRIGKELPMAQLVLLRDDVEIARHAEPPLALGAVAAHNSRGVPVDLTGLAPAGDLGTYWRDLRDSYHRALLGWLRQDPSRLRRKQLDLLEQLAASHVGTTSDEGGANTFALTAWLFEQPIFRPALLRDWHGGNLALRSDDEGVVEYSTRLFVRIKDRAAVPMVEEGSRIIDLLRWVGYEPRDITLQLAARERRERNRERWEEQTERPPREPDPGDSAERFVEHHGLRGFVNVSRSLRGIGQIYLDERLLFSTVGRLPFDVEVAGALTPNEHFDNIERDAAFDTFALQMLEAARELFHCFVDRRASQAMALLQRLMDEMFASDLLGMLGYGRNQAQKLLGRRDDDRGEEARLEERLGPLYDAPLFEHALGGHRSLREIRRAKKTPMFFEPDAEPTRHQFESPPAGLGIRVAQESDRLWLALSPAQRRIVKTVRPLAGSPDEVSRREEAGAAFARLEKFDEGALPEPLFRRRLERRDFDMELHLTGGRTNTPSVADVLFVYRGRLITRERWTSPRGTWVVVVRFESDELVEGPDVSEQLLDESRRAFYSERIATLGMWEEHQLSRLERASLEALSQEDDTGSANVPVVESATDPADPAPPRGELFSPGTRPLADMLRVARGDRVELLNDFTVAGLRRATEGQHELCRVDADAVRVRADHPLAVAASEDEAGLWFLASCVYTRINSYYAEISDTDELEFQHRLLRSVR